MICGKKNIKWHFDLGKKNVFLFFFFRGPLGRWAPTSETDFWVKIARLSPRAFRVRVEHSFEDLRNWLREKYLSRTYFFRIFWRDTIFGRTASQKFLFSYEHCKHDGYCCAGVRGKCVCKALTEIPNWNAYLKGEKVEGKKIPPKKSTFLAI